MSTPTQAPAFVTLTLTPEQAIELLACAKNGYGDGSFYNLDQESPNEVEQKEAGHAETAIAKLGAAMSAPSVAVPDSIHTLKADAIEKLPKWARDAFKALERERFCAIRELREWVNDQTPGPVMIDEYLCDGSVQGPVRMTRYVQTKGLRIEWQGVRLDITLRGDSSMHENGIQLQWGTLDSRLRAASFIPSSYQSAMLCTPHQLPHATK